MYQLSIDRIGLVRSIEDKEMHGHFYGMLMGMKDDPACNVWQNKYQTTAILPLSPNKTVKQPGCETLRLQIGISHHTPYFKADFNPANLGAKEWTRLHTEFCCLLEHGYGSLLAEAHVSYLEIAVDCTDVAWKGLLPFDGQLKNSGWFPHYSHPTPTGYLGRRGSNRVIRAYDRIARLLAAGKPAGNAPITRIEASLRRLGCKVSGLTDVENPFKTVGVCRMADAELQSSDSGWKQFLHHCRYMGACEAMQLIGPMKKKYLARLKEVNCAWWLPTKIWELYPGALAQISGYATT
jgi:hypothetical protein